MGDLIDIHGGGDGGSATDADERQHGLDIEDDEVLASHPLVQAFRDPKVGGVERLRVIKEAMCRAAAELEFQRLHPEAFEQPEAGRAVTRRVRALKKLKEVELSELRAFGPRDEVDPSVAERLIRVLHHRVVEVIHEALPEHMAAAVEAGLRRELEADERIPWPSPEVE